MQINLVLVVLNRGIKYLKITETEMVKLIQWSEKCLGKAEDLGLILR